MAFDFPATPTEGQTFQPAGGPLFVFRAPTWRVVSSDGTPVGSVAMLATTTAPLGWLKANGALINRVTYAGLFAVIGTTFGAGDGSTTFALPDLRGEFLRGWNDGRAVVDAGRAFGSLQTDGLKTHDHTFSATSGGISAGHTHGATGLTMGTESADHTHTVAVSGSTGANSVSHTHTFADSSSVTGTGSANHSHSITGVMPMSGVAAFGYDWVGNGSANDTTPNTNASGAAHTHTVAVSGSTGGVSANHTHTFSDASSTTGGRSAGHTHAMTGNTAAQSVDHTHTTSGTVVANVGGTTETRPRNIALLACIKY